MLRRIFTFVPVILLLGSALLLFFINLIGSNNSGVMGRFYWSEVESQDFGFSGDKARWTLYSLCSVKDGKNSDCTSRSPAYPYSPVDNFDSTKNLPENFKKQRNVYYYLSRFAYAFFLIGIVFSILAIVPTILSCCFTGFVTGILGSIASGIAFFFTLAGAAFITAVHVKGRNAFRNAGYSSSLSAKTFGILWASVACLFLSLLWNCCVAGTGAAKKVRNRKTDDHESYVEHKHSSSDSSRNENLMYNDTNGRYNEGSYNGYGNQYEPGVQEPQKKRFFFRRT